MSTLNIAITRGNDNEVAQPTRRCCASAFDACSADSTFPRNPPSLAYVAASTPTTSLNIPLDRSNFTHQPSLYIGSSFFNATLGINSSPTCRAQITNPPSTTILTRNPMCNSKERYMATCGSQNSPPSRRNGKQRRRPTYRNPTFFTSLVQPAASRHTEPTSRHLTTIA